MWRVSSKISKLSCLCGRQSLHGARCELCTKAPKAEASKPAAKSSAPPPPPPPPKSTPKKSRFFSKFLGLTIVGAGGVVGYAWYDPNFRKQVEDNVPYSHVAFTNIFSAIDKLQKYRSQQTPVEPGSLGFNAEEAKQASLLKKTKPEETPAIEAIPEPSAAELEKAEEIKTPAELKKEAAEKKKRDAEMKKQEKEEQRKKERERIEREMREKEASDAAENAALEHILQQTVEDMDNLVTAAIVAQKSAATAAKSHAAQLKKAMDISGTASGKEEEWEAVTTAFQERTDMTAQAGTTTEEANILIEKLRAAITDGKSSKITRRNKAIHSAEEKLNKLNYDLKAAVAEHDKAESQSRVMSQYRDLVKKGREQFQKEIAAIQPDVKLAHKGGKMNEEELNSLIAHAHRRIEQLQRQLAEALALEHQRTSDALDNQREEDERLAAKLVETEQENMRAKFSVEREKWDDEARVRFDQEVRVHLGRQAAAHSDHLGEVLSVQKRELQAEFDALLEVSIIKERDLFQKDVATWVARLRGIEAAVEGRAEMEKQGRKAQELWLACQSLQNVIRRGGREAFEDYEEQLRPLAPELAAISEASHSHPLVTTVISSMPNEALARGVWTEDGLLDRFTKVRRMCRRVALIDDDNHSLFRYLLSYAQSMFMLKSARVLSDREEIEPDSLSAFMLLDNAGYCLERGDLEQAVRYMNQLKGESRDVASSWIQEARLLLETRQAASALLAHASARGIGALF